MFRLESSLSYRVTSAISGSFTESPLKKGDARPNRFIFTPQPLGQQTGVCRSLGLVSDSSQCILTSLLHGLLKRIKGKLKEFSL
ncbi:hypothetical protein AOLI_G00141080 [Acnodon oligacanthus]